MSARRDPDRLIDAFLHEGAEQLHDQVYDAVRSHIDHTRQRAVIGPWRLPDMNKLVPIGIGAAAVVAVFLVGSRLLPAAPGGTAGVGSTATPTATAGPTATAAPTATPTPSPTASPATSPPPLTQTFTSKKHGFSMSYPEGWAARAAGDPWTDGPENILADENRDVLYDPVLGDGLFLFVVSGPIGDSTPEDWVAARIAQPVPDDGCTTPEPITVDGATGLIGAGDCDLVVFTTAGRGYEIYLYNGHEPAPYDRAWFEEVLATVQLHPEDAVDVAPSSAP